MEYDIPKDYLGRGFQSIESLSPLVAKLSHPASSASKTQLLTHLQQAYGNRYVQRAVSASRSHRNPAGDEMDPSDERLYNLNSKDVDRLCEELYQGSGETWCDTSSGTPDTSVTEHCAGDCVQQHEDVHVNDISDCCAKYANCVSSGGSNCATRWRTWINSIRDWTECNAYTREVNCLTSLIENGCGEGGTISASCCTTLRSELATATRRRDNHCPGTSHPCPF